MKKSFITHVVTAAMLMGGLGLAFTGNWAEAAPMQPKTLTFATQSVGSAAYARIAAMSDIINKALPAGWKTEPAPISTGGLAGALLVEDKKTDMGSSINVTNKLLMEGGIEGYKTLENARAVWGGTDPVYYFVLFTESFHKKTGFTTLEELIASGKPFRLVTKAPGSSGEQGARDLLKALGTSFDKIRANGGQTYHLDPSQMADMLKEEKADVCIDVPSLGQPALTELTMTTTVFLPQLSDATLDKLATFGYPRKVMPAGSWNGQKNDIMTAVAVDAILINKDVPDEIVYLMAKAISEGKDNLAKLIPATKGFDPTQAGNPMMVGCPLHPGAEKFYREKGYLK